MLLWFPPAAAGRLHLDAARLLCKASSPLMSHEDRSHDTGPVSPHPSSVTKLDTLVIPGLNSKGNISWIVPGSKEEGMDMFYVYLGTMQRPMCGKLGWQLLDTIIERRLDHEGSDLISGPIHQDS